MHWELAQNSTFAVAKSDGERAILRQHCGLPIGGHLSAALVELVALWMEYTTVWPVLLHERVTARYRDIFFGLFSQLAMDLSTTLAMPVKMEKAGTNVHCLGLRL